TIPYIVDVAAKDKTIDAFLIGGSTTTDVTPQMIEAIPGVTNPFNMSYDGSLPLDREFVTQELLKYAHPRRVLLSFDYTYSLDAGQARDGFPFFLYNADPFDDLQMVGSTAAL